MNMQLNEQQYERIAQWLDGADVELTPAEFSAAEEIRQGEANLAKALNAGAPAAAMARAKRRTLAALASPTQRSFWIRRLTAGAAAAIVLIAAMWMFSLPSSQPQPPGETIPLAKMLDDMENPTEVGLIDLLVEELEDLEAEMAVSIDTGMVDMDIDAVETILEDILFDESAPWSSEEDVFSS